MSTKFNRGDEVVSHNPLCCSTYFQRRSHNKTSKKIVNAQTIILFVFLGLFVGFVGYTALRLDDDTINLDSYIRMSFVGYDGMGTAAWEFDKVAFEQDYADKLPAPKSSSYNNSCELIEASIGAEIDQTEALSNGDTVSLTWSVDTDKIYSETGFRTTYNDQCYEVNGLIENGLFDPFSFITVRFDGISGHGTVSVEKSNSDDYMSIVKTSVDRDKDLSNGDEITVTLSSKYGNLEQLWEENFGFTVESMTKTYTVSGLCEYISSLEQINDETLAAMKSQAEDVFLASTATWENPESISAISYCGTFFLKSKGVEFRTNCNNAVELVYKVTVDTTGTDGNIDPLTFWYVVGYTDLYTDNKSICHVALNDYFTSYDKFKFNGLSYHGFTSFGAAKSECLTSKLETYNAFWFEAE